MAEINVVRKHRLTVAQAKRIAQKTADDLASEYDLQSEWHGDTLRFSRSGVNGSMAVSAHEIRLDVKLGLLLGAFKRRIERHIEHRLDELLIAASTPAARSAPAKKSGRAA
ncbi:MAG TPA: polyhydroxyalkanoic acid system family protein [Burkholderiaceae bacterium]|nr:polyhydroxyalkanoic acid system family protein [Burkholderiaceae bacterium]